MKCNEIKYIKISIKMKYNLKQFSAVSRKHFLYLPSKSDTFLCLFCVFFYFIHNSTNSSFFLNNQPNGSSDHGNDRQGYISSHSSSQQEARRERFNQGTKARKKGYNELSKAHLPAGACGVKDIIILDNHPSYYKTKCNQNNVLWNSIYTDIKTISRRSFIY
jgi:hypothetical protein